MGDDDGDGNRAVGTVDGLTGGDDDGDGNRTVRTVTEGTIVDESLEI